MLLKNREFRRAIALAVLITLALVALCAEFSNSLYWGGMTTAEEFVILSCGFVLATAVALTSLFVAVTTQRYRALAQMAERVDLALHDDRSVSLADMNEGELAILASEIDKALTRLTITAEELNAEKRSLADSLADISHQLRTPLTSLGLTLELARKEAGGATPPEVVERIRTSERLLAQVQWLVEALLKLARIDAGTVELNREPVAIAELVNAAVSPLAIPYDLADVQLELELEAGAGFTGDAAWTREALENVLKNCLEHTPAGGRVRVEASEDALASRITVTDTGHGIAAEDLPHVFERFYRGRGADSNSVNPAGVGIGLSLAQSLIAAQDGRITASNVLDEHGRPCGARFAITFFKAVV